MNRAQRRRAARGRHHPRTAAQVRRDREDRQFRGLIVMVHQPDDPGVCEVGLRCDLHAADPGQPCGSPTTTEILWGDVAIPPGSPPWVGEPHASCDRHALEELEATIGRLWPEAMSQVMTYFAGDRSSGWSLSTGPLDAFGIDAHPIPRSS